MKSPATLLLCMVGLSGTAAADDSPMICFGNEPFWSVDLTEPGVARFSTPDQEPVRYRGSATRHAFLQESVWRGSAASGRELVVWVQQKSCSDGMSDTEHPFTARVSLPDGRFLSGCCRIPAREAGGGAPAPLEGTVWRLEEITGPQSTSAAGLTRPATVRFESGRLSGYSGCNNFSGSYRVEGGQLTVGPVASTQMACPEPGSSVEQAFHKALTGTLQYSVAGDALTLTSASGATLRFDRQPPPQLAGVKWKVTSFNNGRQAVVGVIGDTRLEISFGDGKVSGDAGCNTFHGNYTSGDGTVEIGPLATTRRACAEPLMTQEREFLAALASAVKWNIDGNVLDMHRADGERAIWAVAE